MVTISTSAQSGELTPAWQASFLHMLPVIQRHARIAFRGLPPQRRDDAVSEVVANCYVAFCRLAERGKLDVAHPTVLAQYAVYQYCGGRMVGGQLNVRDVLSTYAQRQKQFCVERLNRFDHREDEWRELIVEDHRAGPAETAAMRIDFAAWLAAIPVRKRRIAELLATGESTAEAARLFGLTAGRISQLRRELRQAWHAFQSEAVPA